MVRLNWLTEFMPLPTIKHFIRTPDDAWLLTTAIPGKTAFQVKILLMTGNRISRARYVGGATEFLKWWPNYGYTRRTVFGICALLKPVTFGKRVVSS
ncbi:unnamed protein product [Oppiella nova]|uniref:Uncharacterized protein n=1 Tax=Oppiella nova TaxID=334625 RepID=A0A7R9R1F3_9ACAR|nr:unnamed protein product [Oppiella nova]CAG2182059.1 unnamed protein product [Oppiella nova]